MNAYTGGMANFSSGDNFILSNILGSGPQQSATDGVADQNGQSSGGGGGGDRVHLPTGGIRTAFHQSSSQEPPEKKSKFDHVLPTPLSAMMDTCSSSRVDASSSYAVGPGQSNSTATTTTSSTGSTTQLKYAKGISLRGSVVSSAPTQ
jgi:hypothetical protein